MSSSGETKELKLHAAQALEITPHNLPVKWSITSQLTSQLFQVLGLRNGRRRDITDYEELSLDSFDAKMKTINTHLLILSVGSIACMIAYNHACYDEVTHVFEDDWAKCHSALYLHLGAWLCYVVFIFRLIAFYQLATEKHQIAWRFSSRWAAFMKTDLKYKFLFELVVNALQPLPISSGLSRIGHQVFITTKLLRLYLLVRFLRYNARVYVMRRTIKRGTKFDHIEYATDINTILKSYFHVHPMAILTGFFVVGLFVMAYLVYLVEREYWIGTEAFLSPVLAYELPDVESPDLYVPSPFSNFHNCLWFMGVTMTTLGYGDITPIGFLGRFFAFMACMFGILFASLILNVINNYITPSEFQTYVIDWYKKDAMQNAKLDLAARMLQRIWRVRKMAIPLTVIGTAGQRRWRRDRIAEVVHPMFLRLKRMLRLEKLLYITPPVPGTQIPNPKPDPADEPPLLSPRDRAQSFASQMKAAAAAAAAAPSSSSSVSQAPLLLLPPPSSSSSSNVAPIQQPIPSSSSSTPPLPLPITSSYSSSTSAAAPAAAAVVLVASPAPAAALAPATTQSVAIIAANLAQLQEQLSLLTRQLAGVQAAVASMAGVSPT